MNSEKSDVRENNTGYFTIKRKRLHQQTEGIILNFISLQAKNVSDKKNLLIASVLFVSVFLLYFIFVGSTAYAAPKLVIQSGFESDVTVVEDDVKKTTNFVGSDNSLPSPNSWDTLNAQMGYSMFYRGSSLSKFEIVRDPLNAKNKVAKFQIVDHKDGSGRAQGTFFNERKYGHTEIYNVYHVKYRQYISPDYEALKDFKPIAGMQAWTDFFELWTPTAPKGSTDVTNAAGAFRINFEFQPNNLGGFEWVLLGQDMEYKNQDGYQTWKKFNETAPVPFGKWAEWDVYVVKGADPKNNPNSPAQVIVKMKPDGEDWITLFDVKDERTEHSWLTQEGYYQYQPFKNYLGNATTEFLKKLGKTDISLYFDDFRLWVDTELPPAPKRPVITPAPEPTVYANVIVDNSYPEPYLVKTGVWNSGKGQTNRIGIDYFLDGNTSESGYSVKYTPNLPSDGTYKVLMYAAPDRDRAAKVPVDIVHATGKKTVEISQRNDKLIELGEYTFKKGMAGSVTIRNDNVIGVVLADAIEFRLITPMVTPTTPDANAKNTPQSSYIDRKEVLSFRPDAPMTRAEVATLLSRLLVKTPLMSTVLPFSDVPKDHWANPYVASIQSRALISGYEDGTFGPTKNMTRAELAAMISRIAPLPSASGFTFYDIANHWAESTIAQVAKAGYMNGYEDGTFKPNQSITRAEVITVLNRVFKRQQATEFLTPTWLDVPTTHWAFFEIQSASVDR